MLNPPPKPKTSGLFLGQPQNITNLRSIVIIEQITVYGFAISALKQLSPQIIGQTTNSKHLSELKKLSFFNEIYAHLRTNLVFV